MPIGKIIEYLDYNQVNYSTLEHAPAYTAPEVAEAAHIHGQNIAKVVVVKLDGKMAMVVLPSHYHVSLDNLKGAIGVAEAELATESEFSEHFPGCELGAIPPFGHLFGMDTFIDSVFDRDEMVAFSAGSHSELIKMPFRDFERLVMPTAIVTGESPGLSPKHMRSRRGIRL